MNTLSTPIRFSYVTLEQFLIDFRHKSIRLKHRNEETGSRISIHNGIDSHVHIPVEKVQYIQESEQAWDIVGIDWKVAIFKNTNHLSVSIK